MVICLFLVSFYLATRANYTRGGKYTQLLILPVGDLQCTSHILYLQPWSGEYFDFLDQALYIKDWEDVANISGIILQSVVTLLCTCLWHYSANWCYITPQTFVALFLKRLLDYFSSCCGIIPQALVTLFLKLLWHYSSSPWGIILQAGVTFFCKILWHYSASGCYIIPQVVMALFRQRLWLYSEMVLCIKEKDISTL